MTDLCSRGHPYDTRRDGERVCRECNRANSREREQLISAAARHLGLTRRDFKAIHGTTRAACLAALTEPATPKPDVCRQGHPRTPDNVGWKHRPGREPTRYCMACRRDRDADAWAAVAEAAEQAGVSASRYIRDNGGTLAGAATVARRNRGAEPQRRRDVSTINARFERAQQARAQVRAEAEAVWTHVATLDPDQRDWDGLSVLALCSCGWRETYGTRVEALAAASAHTATRPDAKHVRGDRLDRHYQESA